MGDAALNDVQVDDVQVIQPTDFSTRPPWEENLFTLTHGLININAPAWYINPAFKMILGSFSDFNSIAEGCPLIFSPELQTVLTSPEPPPFSFFLGLPVPIAGHWGVYVVCLVKDGEKPMLYVGSGTADDVQALGISGRTETYFDASTFLPMLVAASVRNGYSIVHVGMLVWTPIPVPGLVPRSRGFILAAEAAFSLLFHAISPMITDRWVEHLLPWTRESVEWGPRCSHFCLKEGIRGDLSLTPEELETIAALRVVRRRELAREWARKNKEYINQRGKEYRLKHIDYFRQYGRDNWRRWYYKSKAETPEKILAIAAKTRNKAKAEERFFCTPCELAFATRYALEDHIVCETHYEVLEGVVKQPLCENAANVKTKRADTKAKGTFICVPCDKKTFPNDWSLVRHKATPRHKRRKKAAGYPDSDSDVVQNGGKGKNKKKGAITKKSLSQQGTRDRAKASGKYKCTPCDTTFGTKQALADHDKKRSHIKRLKFLKEMAAEENGSEDDDLDTDEDDSDQDMDDDIEDLDED